MICASESEAKRVNGMAKKMELDSFKGAISYHNAREKLAGSHDPVVVDDADIILRQLIGAEVRWITINGTPGELRSNVELTTTIDRSDYEKIVKGNWNA